MTKSARARIGLSLLGTTWLAAVACGGSPTTGAAPSDTESAGSPAPSVTTASERARIQAFLDQRYTAADVKHSFHSKYGDAIDCVDFFAQPGVKELARRGTPITELPPPARRHVRDASAPRSAIDEVAFDGSLDEDGQARACSSDSVPHVRLEAATIEKAGGLDAFLAGLHKVPAETRHSSEVDGPRPHAETQGATHATAPDSAGYTYAHAQSDFTGGGVFYSDIATVSIWQPTVTGSSDHSLMQTWTTSPGTQWSENADGGVNACAPNCQQTIEVGWTADPGLTGTAAPSIFIYSTPDGYQSGCYNATLPASQPGGKSTCAPWVGSPGAEYAYGERLTPSTAGSTKDELTVEVLFGGSGSTAGWGLWLGVNSSSTSEIGYYPASDYSGGSQTASSLATSASVFRVGAEVDDWTDANTTAKTNTFKVPMGSGSLASAGYGYAAYAHDYATNVSGYPVRTFDAPYSTEPQYATWTAPLGVGGYSPASGVEWQNFFYVGEAGPACTPATCASLSGACGEIPDGCGDVLSCGPCGPTTGCGEEYTPPGYGPVVGYKTVETVSAPVNTTVMYQLTSSGPVALSPLIANLGYPGSPTHGQYVLGVQAAGTATSGPAVGSAAEVESCVGSTCSSPWLVTVANCCTPLTCEVGMCGTQSDLCGGEITCGGCGTGEVCRDGECASTAPPCDGTIINGVCVHAPPIHCGGKGEPNCI